MKPYAESTLRRKYKATGIDRAQINSVKECLDA